MQLKIKTFIFLLAVLLGILVDFYPSSVLFSESLPLSADSKMPLSSLSIIQDNTIVSNYRIGPDKDKVKAILTGYSSNVWETDDTPYITASGKRVEWGIVANNKLPFGTEIKIPELFGDTVFLVEDRMNPSKSDNQVDIWFSSSVKANNFGVRRTYIEIIKS